MCCIEDILPHLFIFDSVTNTSQWIDTRIGVHAARAWSHESTCTGVHCALAVLHYTLPVCDTHILWEISSVQAGILGSCSRGGWFKNNYTFWEKNLTRLGFGSSFRKGHKSLSAVAKR